MKKDIHVAHSPDSDDAFMFYALATRKIDTGDLNYIHTLSDIETLNRKAMEGEFEVSAVSFHAYAYMAEKYALLSCGASMGRNYGPVVVSGKPMRLLIQSVGPRVSHYYDKPWAASEPRQGSLVVIGLKGLDRAAVTKSLAG